MSKYRNGQDRESLIEWLVKLEARVKQLESGNRIGNTSIDEGNLIVRGGDIIVQETGSVVVSGTGDVQVSGGGDVAVSGGGSISVNGGDVNVTSGGVTVSSGGTLRVVHAASGGQNLIYAGPALVGLDEVSAFILRRPDGTLMFLAYGSNVGGDGFWAHYDKGENIVVSDDGVTAHGLATPYLNSGPFGTSFNTETAPLLPGTINATFTAVHEGYIPLTHPRIRVLALIATDVGGTTGEGKVLLDGVQIGTTVSATNWVDVTASVPGWATTRTFLQEVKIEVQVRRTGGTGRVLGQMYACYGVQS